MLRIGNWNFNGVFRGSKPVLSVYSACSFALKVTLSLSVCASAVANVWKLMGNERALSQLSFRYCLDFEPCCNCHKFTSTRAGLLGTMIIQQLYLC
jgi:hypothetical protein